MFIASGDKRTGCKDTIDEFGFCATLRHFEQCGPGGNSKNTKTKHIHRKMRTEVSRSTDENPGKKIKNIIDDSMHKVDEFKNESGRLIAGSMAKAGLKRKLEADAAIHVKRVHNKGVNANEIPEDLLTMDCEYPRKSSINVFIPNRYTTLDNILCELFKVIRRNLQPFRRNDLNASWFI